MKFKTVTLGCKVNHYETAAMEKLLVDAGYEPGGEDAKADLYIINTCAVTNLSASKSRQAIRRSIEENPDAVIAVVGCYAQVSPTSVEEIDGVDIILGTTDRHKIVELVERARKGRGTLVQLTDVSGFKEYQNLTVGTLRAMSRAYVKVQDGCNRFCSYCIIPYARGAIRSRELDSVLEEVVKLAHEGYKEIILTGIHVASYGKDLNDIKLIDLIEQVANIDGVERVRLSSIEPVIVTEDFISRLSKIKEFCPHFHLSLQSGSDTVLKRMNRHYTSDKYYESVCMIRKYFPLAGITTDIIVGFPGETEEEFAETLKFAEKVSFNKIHVFPFSPKEGTPAAVMNNQITNAVKKERAKILSDLEEKIRDKNYDELIGKVFAVLPEEYKKDAYEGYTDSYVRVRIFSESDIYNKSVNVRLLKHRNGIFDAELI